ncbi:hypothetical protein MNBD_GAMMA12-331 [hydrothermal vent metagenome]|uniref:Outer membrane protein beta-barrel domain-containing protein n=1 Tax=hydrothermal vent metagenome TaxID=652676 RepID=A0A3B0YQY8_9ZZZZ
MKIKLFIVICILFSISNAATADHKSAHSATGYFSMGVSNIQIDINDIGASLDHNMIEIKMGRNLNSNFAFEARVAQAVDDAQFLSTANIGIDTYVGLYLVGTIPLSKTVSLYGFAGATYMKSSVNVGSVSASGSDNDSSFGAGLKININPSIFVSAEYADLYRKDNLDIRGTSLSFGLTF